MTNKSNTVFALPSWGSQRGQGGHSYRGGSTVSAVVEMSVECFGDTDGGCPTVAEGRDRKSFLEMTPELTLKEQLGVSQANEATVKIIQA